MTDKVKIQDLVFKKYLTQSQIQKQIEVLADRIAVDYKDKDPVFIVVLNGAYMFASDLLKATALDAPMTFVKISSYVGTESTGNVKVIMDCTLDIKDKDVILVEDIVDTGRTLHHYQEVLSHRSCRSIAIASLLVKPNKLEFPLKIEYRGFDIEDDFVVGYGLDYNEYGRMYTDIYQLFEEE